MQKEMSPKESLEEILQREPTTAEKFWAHLPAFRIGSFARIIDQMVPEEKITSICLFPDFEQYGNMRWGYKIGDEGNIFYPEESLIVLASFP